MNYYSLFYNLHIIIIYDKMKKYLFIKNKIIIFI
ncbi:hypothetical protein M8044_000423 [Columbia Basin potato purple top phytoplasma]|uniref:Uncharacterized protein n=1 Tax=Columbia Basin potato purple top phytoplasma TaxID=307134 RepID=A0ABT5L9C9_9MOLU|nr:hypothetical protein [Columbia Basin potato purple top phytoplasma]